MTLRLPLRRRGRWKMAKLVSEEKLPNGTVRSTWSISKEEMAEVKEKEKEMVEDGLRLRVVTEEQHTAAKWRVFTKGEPVLMMPARKQEPKEVDDEQDGK